MKRDTRRSRVITPMWISSVEMSSQMNSSPAREAVMLSTRESGERADLRPS